MALRSAVNIRCGHGIFHINDMSQYDTVVTSLITRGLLVPGASQRVASHHVCSGSECCSSAHDSLQATSAPTTTTQNSVKYGCEAPWSSSVAGLLASAVLEAKLKLSAVTGDESMGLQVAVRKASKLLPPVLKKRLIQLEVAEKVVQHVDRLPGLLGALDECLSGDVQPDPVSDASACEETRDTQMKLDHVVRGIDLLLTREIDIQPPAEIGMHEESQCRSADVCCINSDHDSLVLDVAECNFCPQVDAVEKLEPRTSATPDGDIDDCVPLASDPLPANSDQHIGSVASFLEHEVHLDIALKRLRGRICGLTPAENLRIVRDDSAEFDKLVGQISDMVKSELGSACHAARLDKEARDTVVFAVKSKLEQGISKRRRAKMKAVSQR